MAEKLQQMDHLPTKQWALFSCNLLHFILLKMVCVSAPPRLFFP